MSEMNQRAAILQPARRKKISSPTFRRHGLLVWLFLSLAAEVSTVSATDKAFLLGGNSIQLQDVSSEVGVYYQSMRFNRAADVWNVEVTLTNRATRTLRLPLILSVESFTNTTGPLQTDGTDAGSPAKPFYDLSRQRPAGILAPGSTTLPRTLTLGRGAGPPRLITRVYALPPSQVMAASVVRSLDSVGHPLADVEVLERGSRGQRTFRTDALVGMATLGQGDGAYTWKFSKQGYLPVWRQRNLVPNELGVLTSPRLSERDPSSVTLTPAKGGELSSIDRSIHITFAAGALPRIPPPH